MSAPSRATGRACRRGFSMAELMVVVALGALPTSSEKEFPCPRVQALGREIFGTGSAQPRSTAHASGGAGIYLPGGSEGLLPFMLEGVLEADVKVSPAQSPVRMTHRSIAGHEVYFVVNDSGKQWEGRLQFAAKGRVERWDPATGQCVTPPISEPLSLRLEPYGGSFVRFSESRETRRHAISTGGLPNLELTSLPGSIPTLAFGEHVKGELRKNPARTAIGSDVWKATGLLRKGQVDTFLFVRLPFPDALNLKKADCLVLDTWVSETQKSTAQLLVILHEKGGGDFLATTGRSLGSAGHDRTHLPFSRFQLAGWSTDADGELDLAQVDEVRVGWGGYLGSEGEAVEFSFSLPQSGSIRSASSSVK